MDLTPSPSHRDRKSALEAVLLGTHALWHPQPFKQPDPAWQLSHPALYEAVLALDDTAVNALRSDTDALIARVSRHVPEISALSRLIALPSSSSHPLPAAPARWSRDIPGRKQAQIEAYATALGQPVAPLLEWCAGKGHLGRLLASLWQVPVDSLEIDPALCDAGTRLAALGQPPMRQVFHQADALDPRSGTLLAGRQGIALHACGDLHRALLDAASTRHSPALTIVPCCYYRTNAAHYRPLMPTSLLLDRDDLHLAVNDTMTAPPRELRHADQARAWKLAFQVWQRQLTGSQDYRPLKPVPVAWQREGFARWCRRLAMREGLCWQSEPDWCTLEAAGMQLASRVRRLELVRLAFRRALEVWLLMDMAVFLETRGYQVSVTQFCPQSLTPRNLMLSAVRI